MKQKNLTANKKNFPKGGKTVNINLQHIKVSDLVKNYQDDGEGGVTGYDGKLNIRPKYQREFVYKDAQRDAVIDTITKKYPLNVMYWSINNDGTYEIIDGQQRTISIAQYVEGTFSFKDKYFHNLQSNEQKQILDYEITVYFCSGTDEEKLGWFQTINIAGEELSRQELRNAVYAGNFTSDAKRYFSKSECAAHQIAGKYLSGKRIRQEYLETVINWKRKEEGLKSIEEYMAQHQDDDAKELWRYFEDVIDWIPTVFSKYRKEMQGIQWGELYNEFHTRKYNPTYFEQRVGELMKDDEIQKKSGIYKYLLTGKERWLNIRTFSENQKRETYEMQGGICALCENPFGIEEMDADHKTAWSKGGKTTSENCQMLCRECNIKKAEK